MRTCLVFAVLALLAVPVAWAEEAAPDVAARLPTVQTVMCATDDNDWQATLERFNLPTNVIVKGFTERDSGVMHFPWGICRDLRAPFAVGSASSYHVFFHEYVHASLHTSVEATAECVSLLNLRYWLRRYLHASKAGAQAVYVKAWDEHWLLPAPYQGSCKFQQRDAVSRAHGLR